MGLTDRSLTPFYFSIQIKPCYNYTCSGKKKKKGTLGMFLCISNVQDLIPIFLFLCDFRFAAILVAFLKVLVPGLRCHTTSHHSSTANAKAVYVRK